MAELIFYYGTMGSSKTAIALMQRFQFIENNREVLFMKPAVDTRDDIVVDGKIIHLCKSRAGLQAEVDVIGQNESFADFYTNWLKGEHEAPDVVICDEAQFLSEDQVDTLKAFAEYQNVPVYCYGLRTDFTSHLFPGSKRLFELANMSIELQSLCECGEPAIINGKFRRNRLVLKGNQVEIGGDDKYRPLCYKCYRYYKAEAEKRGKE